MLSINGARGRNRTGTPVRARDFKSLVSTYFTTRANIKLFFKEHVNCLTYTYIIQSLSVFVNRLLKYFMAHPQGLEPRRTVLETVMLPLH
jgi:hypothetical protein